MVKPDVKVNYYAALELPITASEKDIRDQYRKLGACRVSSTSSA